ncbi:MAG: NAD(P)(+) transhydrogenase (Re/Si-specific) subunit beta [Fermentimonas sp.]|nr:NAD(P)(+) transhydrogenase (Re/Si-specific) subunit beta [Fermentimonas sp.]
MTEITYYIFCGILSIAVLAGLSLMSKVKTAVAGNLISAVSILLGVAITLYYKEIFSAWSIYGFILIGILVGGTLARRVKMIEMPQLVALLNGVGGLASAMVGILSLVGIGMIVSKYMMFVNLTSVLAIIIGLVTLFGSLVATAKLHKLLPQNPVRWKNHAAVLNTLVFIMVGVTIASVFILDNSIVLYIVLILSIVVSSVFGYAFAIRVGGADMPITISLLNSLSGVAGAIAGMAVNDLLLVSVGGIVGASGLFLTQIMCRAMNRSLMDILLGKTSTAGSAKAYQNDVLFEPLFTVDPLNEYKAEITEHSVVSDVVEKQEVLPEKRDESEILKTAKSVIIVPGYGMALAQAQHLVKQLADKFEGNGAEVKFAIHPVAGRMPGHMNVLLAEADVPYEQLFEMDDVNDTFRNTDVVIVIGANDVINPAARDAKDTPIYGMPVLNVDEAKEVFICNYDLQPGYAGVDNPLYNRNEGVYMMLGDAKDSLSELLDRLN